MFRPYPSIRLPLSISLSLSASSLLSEGWTKRGGSFPSIMVQESRPLAEMQAGPEAKAKGKRKSESDLVSKLRASVILVYPLDSGMGLMVSSGRKWLWSACLEHPTFGARRKRLYRLKTHASSVIFILIIICISYHTLPPPPPPQFWLPLVLRAAPNRTRAQLQYTLPYLTVPTTIPPPLPSFLFPLPRQARQGKPSSIGTRIAINSNKRNNGRENGP